MLSRLSSLTLTLWSLGALALTLLLGMLLALSQTFYPAIREINYTLVRDWLAGPAQEQPLVTAWFIILCLAAAILFVNLAACIYVKIPPYLRNRKKVKWWSMFLIHILLIGIMLGHAASFVMGFKYEEIRLLPGQSRLLPNGYQVTVREVSFVDDLKLLKAGHREGRGLLTRQAFHRESNTAKVTVLAQGREIAAGEVHILSPLKRGSLRVTLTGFYLKRQKGRDMVGVNLTVGSNPLTSVFLLCYGLMIAGFVLLAALTPRPDTPKAGPAKGC